MLLSITDAPDWEIIALGQSVVIERAEARLTKIPVLGTTEAVAYQDKEAPDEGYVIAKGELVDMPLRIGDRVAFSKYAGSEIKMDAKVYTILDQRDILVKLVSKIALPKGKEESADTNTDVQQTDVTSHS